MSKLLINEYPLTVLPSLAVQIGLNEAIMLQQIHYWLAKKQNFKNEKYWVYNTYEQWREQFPFWSIKTIKRIIKSLKDKELLIIDKHNNDNFNRTNWYTINYFRLGQYDPMVGSICPNVGVNMTRSYTETTTETTKDINNTQNQNDICDTIVDMKMIDDEIISEEKNKHTLQVSDETCNDAQGLSQETVLKKYKNRLIDEHYMNQSNVVKHKNTSKLYKHCSILLNNLAKGEFKKAIQLISPNAKLDMEWFKQNDIKNLLTKKFNRDELIEIINNLNNYLDTSYYPHYSGNKKLDLKTYLFNERTGRSLALKFFKSPPRVGSNLVQSQCPDIEKLYYDISFAGRHFSDKEKRTLTLAINTFFEEIEKKLKIFKSNHYNIKIPGSVYREHASWVRDTFKKTKGFAPSSLISTKNKFWDGFLNYLFDTYGVDFEPSESALRNARKKFERERKLKELNSKLAS